MTRANILPITKSNSAKGDSGNPNVDGDNDDEGQTEGEGNAGDGGTAGQQNKRIVCYYEGWATYRNETMKYDVNDIDPHSCTHLIYSFAGLDVSAGSFQIKSLDPNLDITQGIQYALFTMQLNSESNNPKKKESNYDMN